jgi:hypothetical protein
MNALEQVREGMKVVAADGDKVGTVDSLKVGNADAVTDEGQTVGENAGPIAEFIGDAFGDMDVPKEREERLLRVGYIHIEGKWLSHDSYVAADEIDRVEGDTVYLKATPAAS